MIHAELIFTIFHHFSSFFSSAIETCRVWAFVLLVRLLRSLRVLFSPLTQSHCALRHARCRDLIINKPNWECTRRSLLDKLWLAAVHRAGELWKPLMDEIWTSIFLSSCLLNKLLLKFIAMFADGRLSQASVPLASCHWLQIPCEEPSELQPEHEGVSLTSVAIDDSFVLLWTWARRQQEAGVIDWRPLSWESIKQDKGLLNECGKVFFFCVAGRLFIYFTDCEWGWV